MTLAQAKTQIPRFARRDRSEWQSGAMKAER
jgi:hypothetical protein